ncbi:heme ABC transporter ATP-binding protein [Antrihabitans cavernicola]|uniref:Heme ABC transporter ATP-binding protein n=1 Tax=Antrihabitans cavernicola TaxID=2495913 RepID=A0A5A7SDL3_9NOCA|nr:heme ABC transporter ATP-binding protein [Spelaeibacter cavernicola]KAA0023624.1 heme ABC transporter ATP-binding protein [Spelaeibacter cavernicola]
MTSALARMKAAFADQLEVPTPTPNGSVTLRATKVSVERRGRRVLADVDFAVTTGEVVALVGPNGAGKSSLIAALAGEHPVVGGSVELDDRPLHRWTPVQMAQRRAVLPQSHTIGFAFTAHQVVTFGRSPWARTARRADDEQAVHDAMAVCDVLDFADRPFLALSGGERARVALARVLAQDTQTILLDEPTAALDLGHQETVMRLARARAEAGAAVVVVLHDLGLAAAYAHRVAVLDGGRLAAIGPPGEIFTAALLSRVYGHPIEVLAHPETGAQLVIPMR